MRIRFAAAFLLVLLCLAQAGCSRNGNENTIGIRGVVTHKSESGTEGTILVEGKVEADTSYDKASVRITKETLIQKDAMSRSFELSDIEIGSRVEVIFEGPVAESYPVQGTADAVRILSAE
jgi:beta-N-acetylhexosaminidase